MAKEMLSVRVDSALRDALVREAGEQGRSMANMLERLLAERYRRVSPSGNIDPPFPYAQSAGALAEGGDGRLKRTAGVDLPVAAPSSVSAAVSPDVHDKPMETVARDLASRNGRCTADVARGTKCKLCGKVHS